jgi:hypothetical protein
MDAPRKDPDEDDGAFRPLRRIGLVVSHPTVCTENLNPNVVMVKSAKHGA